VTVCRPSSMSQLTSSIRGMRPGPYCGAADRGRRTRQPVHTSALREIESGSRRVCSSSSSRLSVIWCGFVTFRTNGKDHGAAAPRFDFSTHAVRRARASAGSASSRLKLDPRNPGLPDDRSQSSGTKFSVIWYGHGRGFSVGQPLHHDMTASLSDLSKAMYFKNGTHLSPRQDT
jgi:hypothetical protein